MATAENDQGQTGPGSFIGDDLDEHSSTDGLKDLVNDIMGNDKSDSQDEGEIDDEEILNALKDVKQKNDFGPPISLKVADAFNKTSTRTLSKETSDRLKQGIQIPENCKGFRFPKVNPEIWQNLRTKSRVTDLKLQQIQGGFSVALSVIAAISDEVAKAAAAKLIPKDVVAKVLKVGMDGANIIGNQFQDMSYKRRLEIKSFLNPDYAGICNGQIPSSEYLFGDNLAETLKSSRSAATVIKGAGLSRNRVHPYNRSSSFSRQTSLNFQRPSTGFQQRWNGPARGQPYNRNPQFNRQSYQTFRPRK